jgi:hypothetical protein
LFPFPPPVYPFEMLRAGIAAEVVVRASIGSAGRVTGCGYFLTVAHAQIPEERSVCHDPIVMGHADGIDCGFLLFLEKREMMIECHTWGAVEVPEDFRSREVAIEVRHDVTR